MGSPVIRRADPVEDGPALLAMGQRFYETTHYRELAPFDVASAASLLDLLIGQGLVLVADAGEQLVGMVGLLITPFPFNHQWRSAHEVMWYVDPDDRHRGAGLALLRAIEPACRAEGCSFIQMLHLESSPAHVARIYHRLGYRPTESAYAKRL